MARNTGSSIIFDVCNEDFAEIAKRLIKSDAYDDIVNLKVSASDVVASRLQSLLEDSPVHRLWIETGPVCASQTLDNIVQVSREFARWTTCIPIVSSLETILHIIDRYPEIHSFSIKGNEAAGFVGTETTLSLICAVRDRLKDSQRPLDFFVWGGIGTPEAAAGVLIMGAKGIVFESIHWLTDLLDPKSELRSRILKLRPDHTELVGTNLGAPIRLFNKGNSTAVRAIKSLSQELSATKNTDDSKVVFMDDVQRRLINALDSTLGPDETVPLGVEASFAPSFTRRFGERTGLAVQSFIQAIYECCRVSMKKANLFKDGPAVKSLGVRYPIIQGAMSWITDEPQFAKKVAEAGALPVIALGVLSPQEVEERFRTLPELMKDMPFALNIVTLDENPYREFHFNWALKVRPRFVVIAAGDPSHASKFIREGIEVIYVTPTDELLKLALDMGIKFVVCEGNEAGGHVGPYSTLTLAQRITVMRNSTPSLFHERTIILAGGIYDRDTGFLAAVLGADAIQVGTAYLATEEIVSTGALAKLYQKKILEAQPGDAVLTGEVAGLRVRSLASPKIRTVLQLEQQFAAGLEDEVTFRHKMEAMTAGSLYIAARGRDASGKQVQEEEACAAEGQFMSGVVAGFLRRTNTIASLHEELVAGPSVPIDKLLQSDDMFTDTDNVRTPRQSPLHKRTARAGAKPADSPAQSERIVITAMSVANSLGSNCEQILRASLAKKCGIVSVPISRWDHSVYYDPRPRTPERTYCGVGAFMDLDISRKDLGIAPHDFRTMTGATRITMFLAEKAISESGILESDVPRERISVLISQNSGEAAGTLQDMIIRGSSDAIVKTAKRVLQLDPEQARNFEAQIKEGRLGVDDTTLLGRLNCSAGGFICNKYGFMGPSFAVSAACATSLVALYTAIQFIRNDIIDVAIVGGGEEYLSPMHFLEFSALGALAGISGTERPPSSMSRPFDLDRDGMVLGEGGGMLVIEKESVARKRGVQTHAYITSVGASNNHLGLVESSSQTQELAIAASFEGLPYGPHQIDFVECHATGTKQGDLEEVRALRKLFHGHPRLVLSSFKSQIGHTLGASGINSLIRGISAMNDGVFPPTLNYEKPDRDLAIEESGMVLLTDAEGWNRKNGLPRRMQVNAFGFGGSNYVVQIEQSLDDNDIILVEPRKTEIRKSPMDRTPEQAANIEGLFFFEGNLSDQPCRVAVLADEEIAARRAIRESEILNNGKLLATKRLRGLAKHGIYVGLANDQPVNLAFVFPGQGSHYAGMGRELYETFPIIRMWMDRAAEVADFDILHLLFHDREEDLQKTRWQQPALFTLEYAVAQYLLSLGIKPTALAGHSLGELTSLCLAGVYSFEDGFRLVNKRAICMDSACSSGVDPGVMLACDAPADALDKIMTAYPYTFITNINSPKQIVVGGGKETVRSLGLELKKLGFRSTLLRVSMAFHSPIMRCIHDELEEFVSNIDFHPPIVPVVSNTTGKPFPDDPEEIKSILMAHLESPVLWMQDIKVLAEQYRIRFFVEVGPREILCNLITDTLGNAECIQTCLPSAELLIFRTALAKLYARGYLKPLNQRLPLADQSDVSLPVNSSGTDSMIVPRQSHLSEDRSLAIQAIIQRHINSFILESFGRFVKPAILKSIRNSMDPSYKEEDLESFLGDAFLSKMADGKDRLTTAAQSPLSTDSEIEESLSQADPGQTVSFTEPLTESDVTDIVIKLIMEATGYERDEIEPDMDLREDLSIRSSRLPVIMDSVESHFGIKIELEDFMDVRTIRDISNRISMVIARQGGRRSADEPEYVLEEQQESVPIETTPRTDATIKRVVFRQAHIHYADPNPVEIKPSDPVLVISAKGGTGVRKSTGDVFRRDYGANIFVGQFLQTATDQELFAIDLRSEDGAALAVSAIENMVEPPSGLIIILDEILDTEISDILDVSALSRGLFAIIKTFLQSAAKKFVLIVDSRGRKPSWAGITLYEGLLGVLLSASLEMGYVLFRALTVHEGGDLTKAVRSALNRGIKPVQITCDSTGIFSTEGQTTPLLETQDLYLHLSPSDVIVFSGGGYGITNQLARTISLYGCKVVLLGRTPVDSDQEPSTDSVVKGADIQSSNSTGGTLTSEEGKVSRAMLVKKTIDDLASTGLDVSYYCCDVTDPHMVAAVFSQIYKQHGRIDGIVHGAGILKDNLIKQMDLDDFESVVMVKLVGAWNLFQALDSKPVKFFACLSSAAAIQGNPGQSNYAAGNRMMSALMSVFQRETPETIFKAFMLPPIEGMGMADNPEIRALMKRVHTGYIHVEELTELFWRELSMSPPDDVWILYMRTLPDLKTSPIRFTDKQETTDMLLLEATAFQKDRFPMIDAVEEEDLKRGSLKAWRTFSTERDLWIGDHKPFVFLKHPIISAIMIIETMLESCRILYPVLNVLAVKDVWFLDVIECPPNSAQDVGIKCQTIDRGARELVCEVEILTRIQSDAGNLKRSMPHYKGKVILGPYKPCSLNDQAHLLKSLDIKFTPPITRSHILGQYGSRSAMKDRYRVIDSIEGFGDGTIRAGTIYKHSQDFLDQPRAVYHYSPYLLEALLQSANFYLVGRDTSSTHAIIPYRIGELIFTRNCDDEEKLIIEGRVVKEDKDGLEWEARGVDKAGETIMLIKNVLFRWLTTSGMFEPQDDAEQ